MVVNQGFVSIAVPVTSTDTRLNQQNSKPWWSTRDSQTQPSHAGDLVASLAGKGSSWPEDILDELCARHS